MLCRWSEVVRDVESGVYVCVTKREGCEKFLRLRGRSFVFI